MVRDNGKHINIVDFRIYNGGFCLVVFEDLNFILNPLGFLKPHVGSQGLHLVPEILQGGFKVPLDDIPDIRHLLVVGGLILQPLAGSQAITEVVLQTTFVFACRYLLFRQVVITGTQRINRTDQVEQGLHGLHAGIGAKVLRAVPDKLPGRKNTWETFLPDADPRVGFVVLQQYIIAGLVFLNQVILQQKGIRLGGDYNMPYRADLPYHHPGFAKGMGLTEIRGHPFL